jgi:TolB protein
MRLRTHAAAACICSVLAFAAGATTAAAPDAAPRGNVILFWSDSPFPSLWTIRPDGTHRHRLRLRQNCKRPRLSPDGKWIVFDGTPPGKPPLTDFDVQLVRRDGTGRHALTGRLLATRGLEWPNAWSPNGRKILFTRSFSNHDADLFVMDVDGSHVRRLTHAPRQDIGGTWSPSGSRIVFTSQRLGRTHLFVRRADGTRQRAITHTGRDDFDPSWP